MGKIFILFIGALLVAGCTQHKIKLETSKPLKIDVTMRVDIYQHVEKQINSIEDLIQGEASSVSEEKSKAEVKPQGFFRGSLFLRSAYAQDEILESLSDQARQAIKSRTERLSTLNSWKAKGVIGENHLGLVEARGTHSPEVMNIVEAENRDRKVIYGELAKQNNVSVDEIGKVSVKRLQDSSPVGTPIEVATGSGSYKWMIK